MNKSLISKVRGVDVPKGHLKLQMDRHTIHILGHHCAIEQSYKMWQTKRIGDAGVGL